MVEIITQTFKKSQQAKGTAYQKKIVDLYDSSLVYSFSSVARVFNITSQRVGYIHKTYPHDCPRKELERGRLT